MKSSTDCRVSRVRILYRSDTFLRAHKVEHAPCECEGALIDNSRYFACFETMKYILLLAARLRATLCAQSGDVITSEAAPLGLGYVVCVELDRASNDMVGLLELGLMLSVCKKQPQVSDGEKESILLGW